MGKLGTFLALDGADQYASIEAMAGLLYANWLVRTVPPRRWRSHFGSVSVEADDREPAQRSIETTRRVRLAIARAARNVPTDPNGMPQALVARRMLAKRGIKGTLFVGTRRDHAGVRRLHAWFKVGPEWVTGQCDESHYSLLAPDGPETA